MKLICPCGGEAIVRMFNGVIFEIDISHECEIGNYRMVCAGAETELAAKRRALKMWRQIGGKVK